MELCVSGQLDSKLHEWARDLSRIGAIESSKGLQIDRPLGPKCVLHTAFESGRSA